MTTKSKKIIRLPEVKDMTGLARATIYKKMATDDFPMSINLSSGCGRAVGWVEIEILDWINERIEERDQQIEAKKNSENC
ncbi:phage transcriptional regulator, AlpA [Psychromonas ingrahamii 37]|uniref:Phage transcriptional regulator, AlpA n=1 Tax=Psychromonas ingrahamii (strain DSM 17664 / CCUG 51855 / 37) TaxID=357804 RepID=A1SV81_PSYIN|nr:AlpA family phage regulatory protein [Psychromonas ingrahamii]ABM03396.1 phage transcriptional regulator, AlpA [Psychromonas ingrahamii 37]